MAKKLNELSLFDIVPSSIKNDEEVINIIKAIDPEFQDIAKAISEVLIIPNIKTLPEPIIDLLAWQWHVDFYELANNIDAKRDMVLNSIQWHRIKGTRGAILLALEMLGVEARYKNWHEDPETQDQPYTFSIDAKITGDFWERVDWTKPTQTIRRAITESKSTRSYISRLYIHMDEDIQHDIKIWTATPQGLYHEIDHKYEHESATNCEFNTGIADFQASFQKIRPVLNTKSDEKLNLSVGTANLQGIYTPVRPVFSHESAVNKEFSIGCVNSIGIFQKI